MQAHTQSYLSLTEVIIHIGKTTASSTIVVLKPNNYMYKNEIWSLSLTLYNAQLQMIKDLNLRPHSLNKIKAHIASVIKFIVTGKDIMINSE